jgi:glutamate-1-semialdehyde 2,1-aminomutase
MNNVELYERARQVMPGGVNSSVRFNLALKKPLYVSKAKGSKLWDLEGREYLDMCCAHGAGLLGNAHPAIAEALKKAIDFGYANSLETEYHVELARQVCENIPCADRVRFCSSGSEATLHLIRVCRAFTRRDKIIRIEGHFHGYHELIYIGGFPPKAELSQNRIKPYIESPGIPREFAELILAVPYNNKEILQKVINRHGHETALLILEPVNYNCACIKPEAGYLEFVRKVTREAGIILFFDEIQSVFKKSTGGAQKDFGVVPDVCTIGKSLGGGLPLSGFCGRGEIMDMYQPVGPVQHSGTFNAHLIPVLAGLAFLKEVKKPDFYPKLEKIGKHLIEGIQQIIKDQNLNLVVANHGARFNLLLGRTKPALRYEDTFCHNNKIFLKIIEACWQHGIYFHDYGGSPAHHGYSIQHSIEDIDHVLNVLETVLKKYKKEF